MIGELLFSETPWTTYIEGSKYLGAIDALSANWSRYFVVTGFEFVEFTMNTLSFWMSAFAIAFAVVLSRASWVS